jgi:glycosyltransferase involved in cell wall biosynthesis
MIPEVSVAIPVRAGETTMPVLKSLGRQEGVRLQVSICHDVDGRGANWARNQAAAVARHPFLLFSDADIEWEPMALLHLVRTLEANPGAAYAYGSYEMAGRIQCTEPFSPSRLRQRNFVSTMSLLRRETFPGFDESIGRFQDWDLWLTMLKKGHIGVQSNRLLFRTRLRDGITLNGPISAEDGRAIIRRKHNLV